MTRWLPPLLLALALPAAAQRPPDAQALLDDWLDNWRRAARTVAVIEADERMTREVDGPRGRVTIETEADLRYSRTGDPEREVRRLRINGRDVDPDERRARDRLGRAFGPAGRDLTAVPRLPGILLDGAQATDIEADRLRGRPVWRVDVRLARGADRLTAWVSRDRDPRLLRLRLEGERPRVGQFERTVDYGRVGDLDLAVETRTRVTLRQRRRLRQYVVVLTAEGRYSGYRVGRR